MISPNHHRAACCAACLVLASCSLFTDGNTPRLVSASIVLTNTTRSGSARPEGPFASVLDSIALTVTSPSGEVLASTGHKLRPYESTVGLSVEIPIGDATLVAQVLSNNRAVVFSGDTTLTVGNDGEPIAVKLAAVRPVLLVLPDTVTTSTVTSASYTIYNAGNSALNVSVASVDTAFTRCGTACTVTLAGNSVLPGQTTTVRLTVPLTFPSRLFSFVLRSAEGDVRVFWQYTTFSITGLTIQPPTALLVRGQSIPLTATMLPSGTATTAVTWSTDNPETIDIGATGIVTAKSLGLVNVIARSTLDPTKTDTADVRVHDSTATAPNWSVAIPSLPNATDTISISRDGVLPRRDTVSIVGRATGPAGNFPNPFLRVEFWARPSLGGPWRRIGQSSTATSTDVGQTRTWTWRIIWNPDASDAPFANPSSTRVSIIAIAVSTQGFAVRTVSSNSQVTVVVP